MIRIKVLGSVVPVRAMDSASLGEYFAGTMHALLWYLAKLGFPFEHNFYPAIDLASCVACGTGALVLLGVLIFGAIVVVSCFKNRLFYWSFALMVLPLLPVLQTYALKVPVAERYLYLSSAGFSFLLGFLILKGMKGFPCARNWFMGAAIIVVCSFGISIHFGSKTFYSQLTIWTDSVAKNPNAAEPRVILAAELFNLNRLQEGIMHAQRAVELGSQDIDNLFNLGYAQQLTGDFAAAAVSFQRVLLLSPRDFAAHYRLGLVQLELGETGEAMIHLLAAVQLNGRSSQAHHALGLAYERNGQLRNAVVSLQTALQLRPGDGAVQKDYARIQGALYGRGN